MGFVEKLRSEVVMIRRITEYIDKEEMKELRRKQIALEALTQEKKC
jgi:hypothetical protein